MFECTQIAFNETIEDFRKVDYIRVILTHILYISHTSIQIIKNIIYGIVWWNLILYSVLSALSLTYLLLFIIIVDYKSGKVRPKYVTITESTLKWLKRCARVYSLGMTISAICNLYVSVSPLSIIMTALMITAFFLQIIFEIIIKILVIRLNYIVDAVKADVNLITEPINKTLKIIGKDTEQPVLNKNQKILILKAEALKETKKENQKEKKRVKKSEKSKKIKEFFKNKFKRKDKISKDYHHNNNP